MAGPQRPAWGERMGLVVTNLIKLAGIYVVLHEVATQAQLRPVALGIAALMMAGAQSFETFLSAFFGGGKR